MRKLKSISDFWPIVFWACETVGVYFPIIALVRRTSMLRKHAKMNTFKTAFVLKQQPNIITNAFSSEGKQF